MDFASFALRAVEKVRAVGHAWFISSAITRFPLFDSVFAKNEKENLTKAERNALKKRADSVFENYRRR